MPDHEKRRSKRSQGASRYWSWAIPAAMVVLALAAAVVVEILHDEAEERYQAQTALIELEEEAVHELWLQEEALADGEVTPDLSEGAQEARRETAELLDELEETDPGEGLGRVRSALGSFETAVAEALRLNEAGRLEEARLLDEERVEPAYEALEEALYERDEEYGEAAGERPCSPTSGPSAWSCSRRSCSRSCFGCTSARAGRARRSWRGARSASNWP